MIDFLIIGQGLAGTTLAHTIEAKGYSYHIIDQKNHNSATKVAAGLINPVTGRRYVKSWMVDLFLPKAQDFYTELENKLGKRFYTQLAIRKILANEEIIGFFERKMKEDEMQNWKEETPSILPESLRYSAKNIGSLKGARLDTKAFLESSLEHFEFNNHFQERMIIYSDLILSNNHIEYNGNSYKYCVFCEGYQLKNNPFFNYLPLNLCKGEVLTLASDHDLDACYQKNNFVFPIDNMHLRCGSNYEWNNLNNEPTQEVKKELLDKMDTMLKLQYKVCEHKAGIRPTVKDRRPLLGKNQEHSNLFVFNGLGTKGVSLAPFFANHLIEHITLGKNLMKEVDIKRFE